METRDMAASIGRRRLASQVTRGSSSPSAFAARDQAAPGRRFNAKPFAKPADGEIQMRAYIEGGIGAIEELKRLFHQPQGVDAVILTNISRRSTHVPSAASSIATRFMGDAIIREPSERPLFFG
jgi:hypothetical protein